MDVSILIAAGLYMITCIVNNKIYIGQSENILLRLGRHADLLVKNRHTECPEMQNDFNQFGLNAFRFESLNTSDPNYHDNKFYREKREQEETEKIPHEYRYNKQQVNPPTSAQSVKIHGIVYSSIREAERKTNYSKTTIIRNLNKGVLGFERLDTVLLTEMRSNKIVIEGIVYPNLTLATEVLGKYFNTIKRRLEDAENLDYQYYNDKLHVDLPIYDKSKRF